MLDNIHYKKIPIEIWKTSKRSLKRLAMYQSNSDNASMTFTIFANQFDFKKVLPLIYFVITFQSLYIEFYIVGTSKFIFFLLIFNILQHSKYNSCLAWELLTLYIMPLIFFVKNHLQPLLFHLSHVNLKYAYNRHEII